MTARKKILSILDWILARIMFVFNIFLVVITFLFATPIFVLNYILNVIKLGIVLSIGFFVLWAIMDAVGLGQIMMAFNDFFDTESKFNILIALFLIFVAHFTYIQMKGELN